MEMLPPIDPHSRPDGPAETINKTAVKSFAVLNYLVENGVSTINQVAQGLGLSRTTARRLLDTLASVGHVTVDATVSPETGVVITKFYAISQDRVRADHALFGDDVAPSAERIAAYNRRIAELEQTVAELHQRIAAISDLAAVPPRS